MKLFQTILPFLLAKPLLAATLSSACVKTIQSQVLQRATTSSAALRLRKDKGSKKYLRQARVGSSKLNAYFAKDEWLQFLADEPKATDKPELFRVSVGIEQMWKGMAGGEGGLGDSTSYEVKLSFPTGPDQCRVVSIFAKD